MEAKELRNEDECNECHRARHLFPTRQSPEWGADADQDKEKTQYLDCRIHSRTPAGTASFYSIALSLARLNEAGPPRPEGGVGRTISGPRRCCRGWRPPPSAQQPIARSRSADVRRP